MVPKGGGYQERDATKTTMDPDVAAAHVAAARERSRALMAEREHDIETYGW
jgi:hypothetical protein